MNLLFVGIDWANQHHDICIMHDNGSVFKEFRISNKIIHQLWVTRTTYNENYHLAQITKRALAKNIAV
ncbi:MAG: IS110 family transposase [Candidatus Brocadiaceae bacterium]|nr:IS110 family transposase [Candidatus Brocadiaceae bacterium]